MKTLTENIKAILAIIIITLTFTYFFAISFLPNSVDPQIIIAIITMNSLAIGYYFGSSVGSSKKGEMLAELVTKTTITQDKGDMEVVVEPAPIPAKK